MRHILWVLLLGLSALAAAQNEQRKPTTSTVIHLITQPYNRVKHRGAQQEYLAAIAQLADVSMPAAQNDEVQQTPEAVGEPATDKAAQGILDRVSAVIDSLRPGGSPAVVHAEEETPVTEASETVPSPTVPTDDTAPEETVEGNVASTEAPTVGAVETEEVVPGTGLTKKEKLYNDATDTLLEILATKMKDLDTFPIQVDENALLSVDKEAEVPPTEEEEGKGTTRKNTRNKNKNKNKNKSKKNKKNKKRNNKRRNRLGLDQEEEEEEEGRGKNKSVEKKNNKNNSAENNDNRSDEKTNKKNRNKNKNRNRNQNKNMRKKKKTSRNNRKPKAMGEDEEQVEQGRRKGGRPVNMSSQHNQRNNNKNKNKKNNNNNSNKRNQNRDNNKGKNKNKKNKNKARSEIEAREEPEVNLPTAEERSAMNALLTGLSNLQRDGNVVVDDTGKKDKVVAHVTVGPLSVDLKDKRKALKNAKITTNLGVVIHYKVKSVAKRHKINISGVEVLESDPSDVLVNRNDMDLEAEVVSTAQQQIVSAIDTGRIGRVLSAFLEEIVAKEDVLENMEEHPFLRNTE